MSPLDHLGKYQIVEQTRYGSLGRLYKAHDPLLKRDVAVKVIVEEALTDEVRSRFFTEARASAKLNHPNIITVHDVGEDQGRLFIVMEYIEGEGLDEVIRKRADLPLETRLSMMLQICRGLSYAHGRGIVHADVKPGNIMVLHDRTIKLLDFGLARIAATAQAAGSVTTMMALGGSAYLDPERARTPGDHRSDIFSAGAMFFDLAAAPGRASADAAARASSAVDPRPLFTPDPDIPADLAAVLERALRREPAERYKDMAEMQAALAAVDNRLRSEAQALRRRIAASAADLEQLHAGIAERLGEVPHFEDLSVAESMPLADLQARWRAMQDEAARAKDQLERAEQWQPVYERAVAQAAAGEGAAAVQELERVVAAMPEHRAAAAALARAREQLVERYIVTADTPGPAMTSEARGETPVVEASTGAAPAGIEPPTVAPVDLEPTVLMVPSAFAPLAETAASPPAVPMPAPSPPLSPPPGATSPSAPAAPAPVSPPAPVTPEAAEQAAPAAPRVSLPAGPVTPPAARSFARPAATSAPAGASERGWAAPTRLAADDDPTVAAAPAQRRRLIGPRFGGAVAAIAGIAVIALLVTGVFWYLSGGGGARARAELQIAREELASARAAAAHANAERWSPELVADAALRERLSKDLADAEHWHEATVSARAAARTYGDAARQAGAAGARGAADDARTRMLAHKPSGAAGTPEYDQGVLHEQQGEGHYAAGRFSEAVEQFAAAGSGYAAGRRVAAVPPAALDAPRPAPSDAPAAEPADADAQIRDVLRAYARAFETKDLALLRRIRVGMDPDEVTRHRMVFAQTKSYRLGLSIEQITVRGDEADVRGRREDLIVTRGGETIQTPGDFRFSLKRVGDRWRIERIR